MKAWQGRGGATIFTRYLNYAGSNYERLIHWTRMQEEPETSITPELLPYVTHVVDKTIYSLFNEEGTRAIEQGGWRDLIFCGLATESCVLKSATDAFERDYTPWVVRDASASHAGEEAHQAGLLVTSRFIGRDQIVDAATVLADLEVAQPA